jgi:hypothetical protein
VPGEREPGYTALEKEPTIEQRAIMRRQTLIRVAWIPALAGGLGALYAPNALTFYLAAGVFIVAVALQIRAASDIFRLGRSRR